MPFRAGRACPHGQSAARALRPDVLPVAGCGRSASCPGRTPRSDTGARGAGNCSGVGADARVRRGGAPAAGVCAASIWARLIRWRSVIDPIVFVSVIGTVARNRRARVCPHRCWLIRSSATAMRLGLPGRGQDHVRGRRLALRHPALELGAREPHLVGALEGLHVLRPAGDRRCRVHLVLPNARWGGRPC